MRLKNKYPGQVIRINHSSPLHKKTTHQDLNKKRIQETKTANFKFKAKNKIKVFHTDPDTTPALRWFNKLNKKQKALVLSLGLPILGIILYESLKQGSALQNPHVNNPSHGNNDFFIPPSIGNDSVETPRIPPTQFSPSAVVGYPLAGSHSAHIDLSETAKGQEIAFGDTGMRLDSRNFNEFKNQDLSETRVKDLLPQNDPEPNATPYHGTAVASAAAGKF